MSPNDLTESLFRSPEKIFIHPADQVGGGVGEQCDAHRMWEGTTYCMRQLRKIADYTQIPHFAFPGLDDEFITENEAWVI